MVKTEQQHILIIKYQQCCQRLFCRFEAKRGVFLTDTLMEWMHVISGEGWHTFFASFQCLLPSPDHSLHSRDLAVTLYIVRVKSVKDTTEESPWIHTSLPWKRRGSSKETHRTPIERKTKMKTDKTNSLFRLFCFQKKKKKNRFYFFLHDMHCRSSLNF